MRKIIYFNNDNQRTDYCCGERYYHFLDYAFEKTDYFMLVYVNYFGKGYTKIMKTYRNMLKPFEVKSRTNPSWPGTLGQVCPNTTYKIVFYRTSKQAKEILENVEKMSDWSCPTYPQDLAFFKGNQCWFYSVGHEKIAAIIHATEEDLEFLEKEGLALKENAYKPEDDYYNAYDERIILEE